MKWLWGYWTLEKSCKMGAAGILVDPGAWTRPADLTITAGTLCEVVGLTRHVL